MPKYIGLKDRHDTGYVSDWIVGVNRQLLLAAFSEIGKWVNRHTDWREE